MASTSSTSTTNSVMTAAKKAVVETLPEDPMRASILALKQQQARLREEKLQLAKQIRNTRKRQQRLKVKAREMSDEDLVAVLMMRKEAAAAKARQSETSAGGEPSVTGGSPGKKPKANLASLAPPSPETRASPAPPSPGSVASPAPPATDARDEEDPEL